MVDPLSIVSVLFTALTRSKDVWEYLNDIRNAPQHIRIANSNLRACRSALDKLHRFYKSSGRVDEHHAFGELEELRAELASFEETCTELDRILQPFKRRQRRGNGIGLGTRIKWRWKKAEICELRDQLHHRQGGFTLHFMLEIQADKFPQGQEEPRRNAHRIVQTVKKIRSDGSVSKREDQMLTECLEKHLRYKGSFADINDVRSEPSTELDLPSHRSSLILMSPAFQPSMDEVLRLNLHSRLGDDPRGGISTSLATSARIRPDEVDSPRQRSSISRQLPVQMLDLPDQLPALDEQADGNRQTLAPFDANGSQSRRYRNVRDQQGRVIPKPIHEAPIQRSVRSAPGLLDLTRNMDEDETRAFFTGYLRGSDERVEQDVLRQNRHIRSVEHLPQARVPFHDSLPPVQESPDQNSLLDGSQDRRPPRATFRVHQDRLPLDQRDQRLNAPEQIADNRGLSSTGPTEHLLLPSSAEPLRQRQSSDHNARRTTKATPAPKPVLDEEHFRQRQSNRQDSAGDENDYFDFVRSTRGVGLSTAAALQMVTSNIPEPPSHASKSRAIRPHQNAAEEQGSRRHQASRDFPRRR